MVPVKVSLVSEVRHSVYIYTHTHINHIHINPAAAKFTVAPHNTCHFQ